MKRSRVVVAASLGVLAVSAVLWLRHSGTRRAPEAPRADSDEVAQMRAEMADLRERVAASNRVASYAVQAAAGGRAASAEAAPPAAPTTPPAAPASAKTPVGDEELRARLNNRFSGEPPDSTWGKPALKLLDGHIHAGLPAGSRVTSIECRRTMCRIEAQHSNLGVYKQFVDEALLFPNGGWNGPVMTQIMNPGAEPVSSIAYLLREGEEFMPILEQ